MTQADSEELQRKLNQERNRERHERMMEMKEKNRYSPRLYVVSCG